jgi:hypothetical protein
VSRRDIDFLCAVVIVGLLAGVAVSARTGPELPDNGKSILTVSLASRMTLATAAVLLVLKPF